MIEFIPCFQQTYDMVLVVDLEGVGQDMLAVPIKAECLVPKVEIDPPNFLDFGQVFLRHPQTIEMTLWNREDNLKAKYEVVAQDEASKRVANIRADPGEQIVNPGVKHKI